MPLFNRTCLDPPSIAPDEWDPMDITKWPVSNMYSTSFVATISCVIVLIFPGATSKLHNIFVAIIAWHNVTVLLRNLKELYFVFNWRFAALNYLQICKKNKENMTVDEYPHMTCEITGRPCCMGNEAKCRIVSKDECDFFNGTYHKNSTLCSQVN